MHVRPQGIREQRLVAGYTTRAVSGWQINHAVSGWHVTRAASCWN